MDPTGHGDSGDRGVKVRLGSAQLWMSTQNTSMHNYGEQRGMLQAAVRMAEPTPDKTRYDATADSAGQEKHSAT